MNMLTFLSWFAFACASIPTCMFLVNRKLFLPPSPLQRNTSDRSQTRAISLLIPARNEALGIEATITAALASNDVNLEIVVLDDNSEDETRAVVEQITKLDSRVRLLSGPPLPAGWNGKQHACFVLASAARYSRLAFMDADVHLKPDALARLIDHQAKTQVHLLSAFPHQVTLTWLEKWLIPLMHFILLGFLPMARMRRKLDPAYAAGCGQLFLTSEEDYRKAGSHAAIRASRHDGVMLPRAYRVAGLRTDVVDGTPLAECRMYSSAPEVVRGLLKNAIEGIASPKLIVPFTIILIGGTVLPIATAVAAIFSNNPIAFGVSCAAIVISHLPRGIAAIQFRQSWLGVVFHVPAIATFVLIQWLALANHTVGRQTKWRGRVG